MTRTLDIIQDYLHYSEIFQIHKFFYILLFYCLLITSYWLPFFLAPANFPHPVSYIQMANDKNKTIHLSIFVKYETLIFIDHNAFCSDCCFDNKL